MIDVSCVHFKTIDEKSFRYIKKLRKDDLSKKELTARLTRIKRKKDISFALFHADEAMATATITLISKDPDATIENVKVYMSGLFVKEDVRRSGMAVKLLDHIKYELHTMGYSKLTVLVDNSDSGALSFYEKHGFIHQKTYDMDDVVFSLMVLNINR